MDAKHTTDIIGPVAKARKIFDLARDLPRGDAIDLAVDIAGVKRSTASTQYQAWKKQKASSH